jgi:hypothetical protein
MSPKELSLETQPRPKSELHIFLTNRSMTKWREIIKVSYFTVFQPTTIVESKELPYPWSKKSNSAFWSKLSTSGRIPRYGRAVASTKPVNTKLPGNKLIAQT